MTGPRNIRRRWRRWRKKMSTKTSTTTTEVTAEDRRCVQGIGDNDRRGQHLINGLDGLEATTECQIFLLSCFYQQHCLVSILLLSRFDIFHNNPFFLFTARKTISTAIMRTYFCKKCTLTLSMYPLRTGE